MGKVMILLTLLFASGCTSYMELARQRCADEGHAPGTEAFTQCVDADVQKQRLVMGL